MPTYCLLSAEGMKLSKTQYDQRDTHLGALSQTLSHSVYVGFSLQGMSGKGESQRGRGSSWKTWLCEVAYLFTSRGSTKSLLEHCFTHLRKISGTWFLIWIWNKSTIIDVFTCV